MTVAPDFSIRRISSKDFSSASAFQVLRGARIGIEVLPQADRVRRQKKRTVAVEIDQRAERSGRVTRQWHQDDAGIAEHVPLAVHGFASAARGPNPPGDSRQPPRPAAFAASISLACARMVAFLKNCLQPQWSGWKCEFTTMSISSG